YLPEERVDDPQGAGDSTRSQDQTCNPQVDIRGWFRPAGSYTRTAPWLQPQRHRKLRALVQPIGGTWLRLPAKQRWHDDSLPGSELLKCRRRDYWRSPTTTRLLIFRKSWLARSK